ncbi:hypothetical protein [Paracoccus versutus]
MTNTPTPALADGGPAFPQLELVAGERDGHGDAIEAFTVATGGMTLRDWFAGQALAGYFACSHTPHMNAVGREEAEYMYRMADAMLAARKGGDA